MRPKFIHLKVHTAYSLLEGAIKVPKLIELCKKQQMPAVAITDTNNMFGALEFSLAASAAGIQPIIGCQISIKPYLPDASPTEPCDQLTLLVQNEIGYKNLISLVSEAYLREEESSPQITYEMLEGKSEGLIALTGHLYGGIGKALLAQQKENAEALTSHLLKLFPSRLYIELRRHGLKIEENLEQGFLDLADRFQIPLVATNDVYFADRSLYEAHDALLCIAEGRYVREEDRRRVTPEHYFKSAEEMVSLFADLPEAIQNTVIIAQRCAYMPPVRAPIFPSFPTQEGRSQPEELKFQVTEGLKTRLISHVYPEHQRVKNTKNLSLEAQEEIARVYWDRLAYELEIIINMGFAGYFLIVADFIQWAKKNKIPVGPGRGSGAGSLVAWSLTITDIDPIRFHLIFERFLNPERVSMPDFDIDFCQERRDEVIHYVQKRYGTDRVAQIITFGKLQARAVLRDVGRVLQMPYGQVDKICKLVPNNPTSPVTLAEALEIEPQLKEMQATEETVASLIDISLKLEGLYRHASTHAAGVVIGDRPLCELVPLYRDSRSSMPATQFNMKYIEQAGLIKFDFLGLKTLTVIEKCVQLVNERGIPLDISTIPLDDQNTFDLLKRVETVGVFQLEGAGMREVVRQLGPDRFEEVIALVALYRPGPMDDIPRYIACKHGREAVKYGHPLLEEILKESFGVMIYQEQVMKIAQVLSGYTLGSADLLRRAMGKKIKQEMDAQRKVFVEGAIAQGAPESTAATIFDQVAKFAGYGFNKSHSAPYALLAYQTAYLKANYPVEFFAASMTLDLNNIDKLNQYRQELIRLNIPLLPPDINASHPHFAVEEVKAGQFGVRYGLAAIKNVGEHAMHHLTEERRQNGPYKNILDFITRSAAYLNKRQLEALIAAGALDNLHPNRHQLTYNIEFLFKHAQSLKEEKNSQQQALFGKSFQNHSAFELAPKTEWAALEKLHHEFASLGFYLSSHPLDLYKDWLQQSTIMQSAALTNALQTTDLIGCKLAGIIISKKERLSKNGTRYAFVQLSDMSGTYEVTIFSEVFERVREKLTVGTLLLLSVTARLENESIRLLVNEVEELETKMSQKISHLKVRVHQAESLPTFKTLLETSHKGSTLLTFHILLPDHLEVLITLPQKYFLAPTLLQQLQSLSGLSIEYH